MLDEQIVKVIDALEIVCSEIDDIKSQAETKRKATGVIASEVQDYLHLLEADENISDETAAKYGKLIAEKRRKRREFDTYIKAVDPLLTYLAKHENAWAEFNLAVAAMKDLRSKTEAVTYVPRSQAIAHEEKQVGAVQFGSAQMKAPCKILCTTAGGLKILFGSIASASRAFLYSSSEIVACAKGYTEDIDGDRFAFAASVEADPSIKCYYEAKPALIAELNIREQRKKHERHQQELIAAAAGRSQKSQIEKFEARLAKTEEKQNTLVPEAPPVKSMAGRNARPVRGVADDGTVVEYPSVKAAGLALGCDITLVGKAIKGNYRAKGYRWEYI